MNGWLCQDCKSVNSSSANNCYRCWTPRKFAEAPDPATLPAGVTAEQAHAERQKQMRPSRADARSSRRRSWFALAFISVAVGFSALTFAFMGAKGGSLGIAMSLIDGDWTGVGSLLAIGLVSGLLSLLAAIAWFVWFDRVVTNVTPLTGKWPEVSRPMAVIWWLVPVVGQFKGTFVVGHIYGLMAVAGSPGLWLLGLWGITWIGGTMAPGVVNFVVGWLPLPLDEAIRLQDLISNLGQISYIAAGFFAAALILALEHARDVRMSGETDAKALEYEVSLTDRLAGRTPPGPTTSWAAPEAGSTAWPTSPSASSAPSDAWPSGPGDPMAWPGAPGSPADPAQPAWMGPQPPPSGAHALSAAKPITAADPFQPPAARTPAKARSPVPMEPILLMGALVLAGVVAGLTMGGMADPFRELGQLTGQGPVQSTPTPTWPPRTAATVGASPSLVETPETAVPTFAPATGLPAPGGATPTPASGAAGPTPSLTSAPAAATPVPADLVARRVSRLATDGRYRGLADIEAIYTDDLGAAIWDVELGTAGDREWRLQRLEPQDGDPVTLERVILATTVWERGERTDWEGRPRTDRDRPTTHLFDLTDAAQLSYLGTTEVDGVPVYRFEWGAGDARIRRFIRELGAADGMTLGSGELLVTAQGVPVRLELSLVGDGSGDDVDPSLRMTVVYSEVGSDIEIRTPRIGPPLVVLP